MKSPLRAGLLAVIRAYQLGVSPFLAPRCRYLPTCSDYALTAVDRFGVVHGTRLAVGRFCRCHPWGGSGLDEVPEADHVTSEGGISRGSVGQ